MTRPGYEWMVSGDCVEGCTSPPVCPAYWNSPLQAQCHSGQSQCEGVWTFRISEGYCKDIDLSNLLVAYGFNSPSPFPEMRESPWKCILYIDKSADEQQATVLEEIFRMCWTVLGEVVGVKRIGISFNKELLDDGLTAKHTVNIDGIYEFIARPFRTTKGEPRYINTLWGGHVNIGVSEVNRFHDPDLPRGEWNAPRMSTTYYEFVLNPDKHHWLP